jgi:hypothetical protein
MSVQAGVGVAGQDMRTLPSLVSSIVRRPTSCPCLSPVTSSSPWSSSRKNSDEPSRARADGSAGSAPFREDLGGSVSGMIMARRVSGFSPRRVNRVVSRALDVSRGVKSISSFARCCCFLRILCCCLLLILSHDCYCKLGEPVDRTITIFQQNMPFLTLARLLHVTDAA